ncbi:MAG: transcriptional repressor [Sphingomonadaceae bacterium]|nr:transcriptional repressor [Sphingomonadaceae bacterium]
MQDRYGHTLAGEALEQSAQRVLEAAGEQWTPLRRAVFAVLAAEPRPASAYDIADLVGRAEGRRIAANSIYRILDLFVAENLARRVESRNAYLVNNHPGCRHDCIFLVCDGCGDTRHLDDDSLGNALRRAAQTSGFAPTRPVIEVRGQCASCASA